VNEYGRKSNKPNKTTQTSIAVAGNSDEFIYLTPIQAKISGVPFVV